MRPESQPVLTPLTEAAIFLTVTVDPCADADTVALLRDVGALVRTVAARSPDGGLRCVVGIGPLLWDRVFGLPRPVGLHPFRRLVGETHAAPSTPGDLLFHLRARRMDLCFELAGLLVAGLGPHCRVVDEAHGFGYFDQRNLLGFVDGTENPSGVVAEEAVLIGDEDPNFAGGTYVIVQKYVHDIAAWNALSIEDQERGVGRTKLSNVELADDVKPSNSHVALNVVADEHGVERKIVRENMAFGAIGTSEYGTYFIGYARDPAVIEQMLTNMFIGNPPGNHDRILDFSTATTGCLFFVPSVDFLDDPSALPAPTLVSMPTPTSVSDPSDHSLGIGSLKRMTTP